jgi:tetratricopeptide (TPR) repeat protein
MRIFVIPATLILAASLCVPAEVIHLKNGDVIYADQVKDSGSKIQYEKGDNTYTIPKALIERIDAIASSRAPAPGAGGDLPAFTPSAEPAGDEQLLGEVIHENRVNREALSRIEARGNSSKTAVAYYIVARQEFEGGKFADARRDFESALHNDPQNPAVLNYYAALLVRTGSARDAIPYAERASQIAPDSADAFAVLGYAQYASDHVKDALRSWKTSLALRPDTGIERMLARAQRENKAEGDYTEKETGHFVLRYEGRQSSDTLRREMLETLESEYQELARAFGSEPRSSVQVVLYTNRAFFDVTEAPSWTGALNDGKLRIPLEGVDSVTPELARILKHELAHSFVNQLSMGRCPHWLNEGIAQVLEPKSLGSRGPRLAQLFKSEHEIPLNALEGGFTSFSTPEAALAYDESLASVQYITQTYGMSDVVRVLERLAHGESAESALRGSIHADYRQLQGEVAMYLEREFGE